ncbi:MAG: hypothetical protein Harvfovirus6_30 [Harvfovirus sp.]|uniref:Uncharacterized protein n=1 Tax=Harvfovirus sp. TaxID=2487768 RepID=A0A3G5A0W6_9VIRU|nr:MAG: hypothetical protein Harvfovirus6_30 [Harvfovirus sp.]
MFSTGFQPRPPMVAAVPGGYYVTYFQPAMDSSFGMPWMQWPSASAAVPCASAPVPVPVPVPVPAPGVVRPAPVAVRPVSAPVPAPVAVRPVSAPVSAPVAVRPVPVPVRPAPVAVRPAPVAVRPALAPPPALPSFSCGGEGCRVTAGSPQEIRKHQVTCDRFRTTDAAGITCSRGCGHQASTMAEMTRHLRTCREFFCRFECGHRTWSLATVLVHQENCGTYECCRGDGCGALRPTLAAILAHQHDCEYFTEYLHGTETTATPHIVATVAPRFAPHEAPAVAPQRFRNDPTDFPALSTEDHDE